MTANSKTGGYKSRCCLSRLKRRCAGGREGSTGHYTGDGTALQKKSPRQIEVTQDEKIDGEGGKNEEKKEGRTYGDWPQES